MSDSMTSDTDATIPAAADLGASVSSVPGHVRRAARISWRGPADHPRWERPVLLVLLLSASLVYVWKLDQNGWANAYYSAAVQAGQQNPTAFLFGSLDWGNSITVDKPPLSLWVMGVSVRLFGLNSWALLLPQAFLTLGSTYLVYALLRRSFPAYVALLASGIMAFTPITVLLARYNNPDPLMIFLMLSALHAGVRAAERARPRLLFLAAFLLGLGFLAKQLQAFLILPALVSVFLAFARVSWRRRLLAVGTAGAILLGVSLAWPLAIDLTPADQRPFVGGSTHNSMLELTLGYNGINRVIQHEDDPTSALLPVELRSAASDAGFLRLLNMNYGQEIGWLLAPGLLSVLAISWQLFRRKFNRQQAVLAGAAAIWMITTYAMLSFMGNSFHSYYTASLAPPLALCIGIGAYVAVDLRKQASGRVLVVLGLVLSAVCSYAMWRLGVAMPLTLGTTILVLVLLPAAMLTVPAPWPRLELIAGTLAAAGLLVGPVSAALVTAGTPQSGSNPMSGSVTRSENTLNRFLDGAKQGDPAWAKGIVMGNEPSARLSETLTSADPACTWAAATYPGQTVARFELETGRAILPLGGFAALDPSPSLAQFQSWVAAKRVCYLVEQPAQLEIPGNGADLLAIQSWVRGNFSPENIDGVTVYRLVK
ncbi:ArnT family glycosyltransferase [Arthrobacter sp. TE12232]